MKTFESIEDAVISLNLSKRVKWKLFHGYLCRYTKKDVIPHFVCIDDVPVKIAENETQQKCSHENIAGGGLVFTGKKYCLDCGKELTT